MRVLCLLAVLTLNCVQRSTSEKIRYDNYKVYKITPTDAEDLSYLINLYNQETDFSSYQFWSAAHKIGQPADILVAPNLQEQFVNDFKSLNLSYEVLINNVQEAIDNEQPSEVAFADEEWTVDKFNWTAYQTLDQINAWLYDLVDKNKDILEIVKPEGTTHQGREIVGVKLNIATAGPTLKKAVFVESNIHAREWITSAVSTYILNEFVNKRSESEEIKKLVETYEWYWFPVMNPDGFVYSHETNRMWRKTRTRYSVFCWGADPNRNWGYRWMEGGASQNPCTEVYAGPREFSEPSVKIMADFISSIGDNLHAYIDFHSFSQLLMLPYGHTTDHLDNYDELMTVGKAAMEKLKERYGTEYLVGNIAEIIYVATGSSMDWVKDKFKPPIAYTYELRDKGTYGFILPPTQITPSCEETYDSFVAIFQEYDKLQEEKTKKKIMNHF